MKIAYFSFTAAVVATVICHGPSQVLGGINIVGGQESQAGSFPWLVGLRANPGDRNFCGGALVAPDKVLTAAHCAAKSINYIAIGTTVDGDTSEGQQIKVTNLIQHPEYNKIPHLNDLMILNLEKPVEGITPVQIVQPETADLVSEGQNIRVMGWGLTKEEPEPHISQTSPVLKDTTLQITNTDECSEIYQAHLVIDVNAMFCAYAPGTDACQADSGGPAIVETDGNATLVGVVSFGLGCARENVPGVYAKISANLDFIYEHVPSLQPGAQAEHGQDTSQSKGEEDGNSGDGSESDDPPTSDSSNTTGDTPPATGDTTEDTPRAPGDTTEDTPPTPGG